MSQRERILASFLYLLLVWAALHTRHAHGAPRRECPAPHAPAPIVGEPLALDGGDTLPVLVVPELEALCLNFEDWGRMESDLVLVPRHERERAQAREALWAQEREELERALRDCYEAPYSVWAQNLEALEREQARAALLEGRVNLWRGVAVGAGVFAVGAGVLAYLLTL